MNSPTQQQTEAKHTPGPWQSYAGNTRLCVETVAYPAKLTALIYAGVDTAGNINDPEQQANARLIAAAPSLVEVLQLIHANAAESPEWIRSRIDAALAKALNA